MKETWATTMDEFELARRALDDDEVDPAALERVRSRLRREIERERRPRRGRWILSAAAAAAVALVVVIGVVSRTPHEAAASEFRRLAEIAGRAQPLRPEPGEYLLIRSEELRRESFGTIGIEGSFQFLTRLRVSTWVAQERSGFRREAVLSSVISDADRQAWVDAGRPTFEIPRTHTYRPGEVPIHDVTGLPADPQALLRALRSGAVVERPRGDDEVFIVIGEILAQGVASPQLRSALFEVAARLDGPVLVGQVQDPLGRPGTAVDLPSGGSRTRLVFDSESAQLLAIEVYEPGAGEQMELHSWIAPQPTIVADDAPQLGA
jgi:hypothetical protein